MKTDITINITDEKVRGLLAVAFEGGVGYWCCIEDYDYGQHSKSDFMNGGKFCRIDGANDKFDWPRHTTVPLIPGCKVLLSDAESNVFPSDAESNNFPCVKWELTREKIEQGLNLMLEKAPKHFADFFSGNDDVITGDIFLQMCLFGEVKFG